MALPSIHFYIRLSQPLAYCSIKPNENDVILYRTICVREDLCSQICHLRSKPQRSEPFDVTEQQNGQRTFAGSLLTYAHF